MTAARHTDDAPPPRARALLGAVALAALVAACGDDGGGPAMPTTDGGAPDAGPGEPAWEGPARLSETGLYADLATETLADGVIPYGVRYPLWSDGAAKARFLWLPPGETIDTSDMGAWVFPVGTKAWKAFTRDGVRVETRLLEKTADGWRMVSYVWREDGRDADVAPDGLEDAGGTPHDVPSAAQCVECHRGSRDGLLGMGALQQSGPGGALARLAADGRLSDAPAPDGYAPPGDEVTREALGYMHANCGSCHSPWHPLADRRALRMHLPVDVASVDAAPVVATGVGLEAFHDLAGTRTVLVPGQHAASQLWQRMTLRGFDGMPPTGTEDVDPDGVALIRDWIDGLGD